MQTREFVLLLMAGGFASGQVFSFGLKIGLPLNGPLRSAAPQFEVRTHRYTLGPTVQLKLLHGLGFETDLLYKRLEYVFSRQGPSNTQAATPVKISRWELPVLFKYKFAGQHFRPFLDLGGSFNRVVHIPAADPAAHHTAVSVRSWRTSLARPAPMAARTANSRDRALHLASSRFATFENTRSSF